MAFTNLSDGDVLPEAAYEGNLKHGYWDAAIYDADTGGDDTYIITLDPAPASYVAGMRFKFKPTTANTVACTLNVNGLGAKDLKKNVSVALETGDIIAGQVVSVEYDGTNFQMIEAINYNTDQLEKPAGVLGVKAGGIGITELDIPGYHLDNIYQFHSMVEETNAIIIASDIRDVWLHIEGYIVVSATASNVNDSIQRQVINGSEYFNRVGSGALGSDHVYFDGWMLFDDAHDIADPAGADAITVNSALPVVDASDDVGSDFDTDAFFYCLNTNGYLKLHLGTLAGALTACRGWFKIAQYPSYAINDLGDI